MRLSLSHLTNCTVRTRTNRRKLSCDTLYTSRRGRTRDKQRGWERERKRDRESKSEKEREKVGEGESVCDRAKQRKGGGGRARARASDCNCVRGREWGRGKNVRDSSRICKAKIFSLQLRYILVACVDCTRVCACACA